MGRPHCVDGEGRWAGRTVWWGGQGAGRTVWMGRAGGQAALCGLGELWVASWLTAPLVCCLKQGPDSCGFGTLCFSVFPPSSDPGVKEGDVVCYGQHVTLTTLPGVGGQVSTPHTRAHLLRANHR